MYRAYTRKRKPNHPVRVDRQNPIGAKLINFVYFNFAGSACYDAVTGQLFDHGANNIDQAGIFKSFSDDGPSARSVRSDNDRIEFHLDRTIPPRLTLLAKVKYDNQSADQGLMNVGNGVGAGQILAWADYQSAGGGTLRPALACGVPLYGTTDMLKSGVWNTWGYTLDSTTVAAPAAELWVNGKSDGTNSDIGSVSTSVEPWYYMNQFAGGSRGTDGYYSFFAVFDDILTPAEHKSFYENPWQVLTPEYIYMAEYVAPAVGGATIPILAYHHNHNIGSNL